MQYHKELTKFNSIKISVMKKSSLRLFGAAFMLAICTNAGAQGVISTLAGTGLSGFSGDGGPANLARFSGPAAVATDASGNVYVADKNNHRVRKIDAATGNISTVVGTGAYGYSGMGGDAALATIKNPSALYFDNLGNLFVCDNFNDIVFKVDAGTHAIHNHCGEGHQGNTGDGGDANLARTCIPDGVGGDNSGNIYVLDIGNHRIRKVNSSNIVSTFAGTFIGPYANPVPVAAASFGTMSGICADNLGNLYVADGGNHIVRKIDMASGMVRTIAGTYGIGGYAGDGGAANSALLRNPKTLFLTEEGFLFICDPTANVVRVVNQQTGIISTLAGNGSMGFSGDGGAPNAASLNQPTGIWEDPATGKIYIADAGNQRVRVITGSAYKTATMGNSSTATDKVSVFPNPSNGNFTVATDAANATMEIYNIAGEMVQSGTLTNGQNTVSLKQPAGTYTVKVNSTSGTDVQKITIVK